MSAPHRVRRRYDGLTGAGASGSAPAHANYICRDISRKTLVPAYSALAAPCEKRREMPRHPSLLLVNAGDSVGSAEIPALLTPRPAVGRALVASYVDVGPRKYAAHEVKDVFHERNRIWIADAEYVFLYAPYCPGIP